jgi:hypothetical protein
MTNLLSVVKQRVLAAIGLSGVVGGGARGQISQGTWETRLSGGRATNGVREDITASGLGSGVGQAHSSEEAGNERGAKGPECKSA